MEELGLVGFLGVLSARDIKTHQVRDVEVFLGVIFGFIFHLMFHRISIYNMLGGIAVGVMLYLISVLSGEQIGKGDALIVMMTGAYLGFWKNLVLLWVAAIALTIFGLIRVLLRKSKIKDRFAFAPFVFMACLLMIVFQGGV